MSLELLERLRRCYWEVPSTPPGTSLQMALQAESDEERNFFAHIADVNLQRAQWEVIQAEDSNNKIPTIQVRFSQNISD